MKAELPVPEGRVTVILGIKKEDVCKLNISVSLIKYPKMSGNICYKSLVYCSRFPKWGRVVGGGGNLGKMVKNCMKMTKSAFLGQTNFFG